MTEFGWSSISSFSINVFCIYINSENLPDSVVSILKKGKEDIFWLFFKQCYRQTSEMWYFFLENRKNKCDLKFDLKLQSFLPFFQRFFLSGFLAIAINLSDMVKKCMRMKRSLHESWLNLDSWKAFLRQFWEWALLLFYTLGQDPFFCPLIEFVTKCEFLQVKI